MSKETSDIEKLIEKILTYKSKDQIPLIEKYNKRYVLKVIEEKDEI